MARGRPLAAVAADRLLAIEWAGEQGGVEDGLSAARRVHATLRQQLAPVIGETGFDALFARAVKLVKPAHPALREIDTAGAAPTVIEPLCARLAKEPPAALRPLVTALLATFLNLLSTFIGEGLTWKLLRNAWPEALPTEPPTGETE